MARNNSAAGVDARKCSRCGGGGELALVTLRYSRHAPGGRILVYCSRCREDFAPWIGVCIALDAVTDEVFLGLYRTGKTESDPATAVEIVFGKDRHDLVSAATLILEPDETRSSKELPAKDLNMGRVAVDEKINLETWTHYTGETMSQAETRARLVALVGSTLKTLRQGKPFDVVDVSHDWIVVRPRAGSGSLRRMKRERVEHIATLTISPDRLRQAIAEHYPDTRNSSYMAAILVEITK